jgi:hypothetical protein
LGQKATFVELRLKIAAETGYSFALHGVTLSVFAIEKAESNRGD